ncbi:MAG: preprotein translocase subunit YajC [Nocardioidaceae bacterium]|nr:preprotein translocase subunit YajC [Nocardioidaceae bacterium]
MSTDAWANIAFFLVFFAIAYLLFIRPARKRAQEASSLQSALSAGDDIMLTSGIFGRVVSVDGETVSVDVAGGVVLRVHRGAVGKIVDDVPGEASAAPLEGADTPLSTTSGTESSQPSRTTESEPVYPKPGDDTRGVR